MKTRIFLPPLRGMTGGVAVLHQLAQHLFHGGHDVAVVPRETATPVPEGVPVCPWDTLALDADDLWLIPEGWVNALTPGLRAKARCVVYVQNWAYLLSALPEGVHWAQLPVHFLAVSQPVAWFTERATGRAGIPILRPGIDTSLFHPQRALGGVAHNGEHGQGNPGDSVAAGSHGTVAPDAIRIAWMPRKNKALAVRIRETVEARRALLGKPPFLWEEIHGKTPEGVAQALRTAHIFLSTGFPEGCPLPPLEAMASGCIVAGFSGLGGWDYLRQALPPEQGGYVPWWPLRDASWQGNALVTADADVPAAANALELAAQWLEEDSPALHSLRGQAVRTLEEYTVHSQRRTVLTLWEAAERGSLFAAI